MAPSSYLEPSARNTLDIGLPSPSKSVLRSAAPQPSLSAVLNSSTGKVKTQPSSKAPTPICPPLLRAESVRTDPPFEEVNGTPTIYTISNLPPRALVSKVLDAFYTCSGTLFFLIPRDSTYDHYRSLYLEKSGSCTRLNAALGELSAIMAVGGQYDHDNVSAQHRKAFFETAKVYIGHVMKMSELRAMRVHGLLAMYSIFQKRIAAWSYISSALKIAQTYGLHKKDFSDTGGFSKDEWKCWRKTWRTLKFFESWLAGTLGRIPDMENNAQFDDIRALTVLDAPGNYDKSIPGVDIGVDIDRMQSELGKVGFLMASILKNIYRRDRCSIRSLDLQMRELEKWHIALPHYMRLETLASDIPDMRARRSIMLVHMIYLGSIILLTRKLVIQLVSRPVGAPWVSDGTKEEARNYMEICFASAMHTAKLCGILLDEGTVFKRCWCIINHAFNALVLLLFHVVQKKRHGRPEGEYFDYLRSAAKLVRVLLYCSREDGAAFSYLRTAEPFTVLFEQLIPEDPEMEDTLAEIQEVIHGSPIPEAAQNYEYVTSYPALSSARSDASNSSPPSSFPNTPPEARSPEKASLKTNDSSQNHTNTNYKKLSPSLDVLAEDLFEVLRAPFGGEDDVESGPELCLLPEKKENSHWRFWSGGWKKEYVLAESQRKAMPLKRLYDDSDDVDDVCGGEPSYGKRWKGMGLGECETRISSTSKHNNDDA